MCKKVFGFLLVLVMVTVAFAGDYYLVEPEGKMVQVEKRGDTFVPIRGAKPIDSPVTSFMSPGFVDTTQMNMFESGYYFPNRDSNSVHLQYFQSGFACSLMAVGFEWYSAGTAEAYVWEAPDPMPSSTEDLQAHLESAWEFDTVANNWVAMDPILSGPELVTVDDAVAGWYELPSKIDIGTSFVGVGYRILDPENPDGTPYGGNPWGLSDDFVDQYGFGQYAPCITWMYRVQHAHPSVGQFFGWVPYGDQVGDWRFYYVIDIYVNAPPSFVSYDRLPGSYITDARTVSAYLYDFGVPSDMAGVDEAVVYYWTDSEPEPVALAMSLVDGTPEEGRWEAEIPGQTGWTTVHYYIEAT
ncbi:hypothetical protein JW877_02275, partial [bacterium]|nr:hypothetical protein [bacterium]